MNAKLIRNLIFIFLSTLIVTMTYFIINYKNKVHETNKDLFTQTIFQAAKAHFENIKVFRAWNAKYGGVYVKANDDLQPNEYLKDNAIKSENGELLVKINPAWMTRQISEMINEIGEYEYKITSLKPLNPSNKANEFEQRALKYFERNMEERYFSEIDYGENKYNFIGRLTVEESCLACHAIQGYKLGEVRGGISVSIPLDSYQERLDEIVENYSIQVIAIVLFSLGLILVIALVVDKIYKNQMHLSHLKDKYKILYDRYDYAVSGSKLGLWDWDLKTDEVYFSKLWKKMLGYEDHELENKLENWAKRVHPDDKEKAIADIKANQEKKTEFYENIHRLKHKNGTWVWILDKGRTIFDEDENPIRMVGFHTNITKSQMLKQELLKLKIAIEHSPISIVITNMYGEIEYVNPHFTKVTGYKAIEAFGKNPRILKSEFTSSNEYKNLWDTLMSKKTWRGTFKNIDKDGNEFWESAIITPILNDNNEIMNFLAVKQEITKEVYLKEELKDKEEMMIAQSRHAAMGEMISMIAHQWRQPISVISMAANNTLVDLELDMLDNEELKDNTESILEQTKYLSQTIDDFRDFFKPNKEKELATPKDIMDETLKIMGKSLENNGINISINVKDEDKVKIYSRELLQVFINIIKNAKEALVTNDIANKNIEVSIFKINKVVRTLISDNAGGVHEEIIPKIFDPYFSTKDEKSGTGLGLYMCKTIVEKHLSGEIGVYNCDDGACFYVDLPVCEE